MADTKLSALTTDTTVISTDLEYVVRDPAGTPASKGITVLNKFKAAWATLGTTLGDLIYSGASGVATRLAGNTTTTKKYLAQTGDGANSAAPAWSQPAATELSDYAASGEGTLGALTWTAGAAPSGTISQLYRYTKVGKLTIFSFDIEASVAGTTVTKVRFELPSGVPLPADFSSTGNGEVVVIGTAAALGNAKTSAASTSGRCYITKDSGSSTGYYVNAESNSSSAVFSGGTLTYQAAA